MNQFGRQNTSVHFPSLGEHFVFVGRNFLAFLVHEKTTPHRGNVIRVYEGQKIEPRRIKFFACISHDLFTHGIRINDPSALIDEDHVRRPLRKGPEHFLAFDQRFFGPFAFGDVAKKADQALAAG